MSRFGPLLRMFGWRSNLVGKDLYGNKFYEYPSTTDDPRRTRRIVEYADKKSIVVSGGLRLLPQWSAWLSHTRPHAPTLEELQRDQQRLATVQHNARILEERDRQVRLLEEQQRRPPPIPERSLDRATPTPQAPKPSPARPKPTSTSTDYQPEQWTPAASRR